MTVKGGVKPVIRVDRANFYNHMTLGLLIGHLVSETKFGRIKWFFGQLNHEREQRALPQIFGQNAVLTENDNQCFTFKQKNELLANPRLTLLKMMKHEVDTHKMICIIHTPRTPPWTCFL